MSLLSIRALEAAYDSVPVLHSVSLDIAEGSFVAVIGANTAGKSTLLRSISGLVPRVSGEIRFNGADLLKLPSHRIPELGIAHVPEGRQVFPAMTVEENLMLGAFSRRKDKAGIASDLERVYAQFARLAERRSQLAGTLSGGEQQMCAIGRALMGRPRLLLLDEPSHGLAPKVVQELHDALVAIHATGVTMLLIEQNTRLALSVTTHAFVMQSGRIVFDGQSKGMLDDDRIREAFLGI